MKRLLFIAMAFAVCSSAIAQQKQDKSTFKEYKPGYYQNSILKDIRMVNEKLESKDMDKKFFMDQSSYELPNKVSMYKDNTEWAQNTVSQGNTGTCWCFSATSFYESEVYRLHKKKVKISELYTVYWEYVEKARRFIQERGNSHFEEGAEGNSVARMWNEYGVCPQSEFTGLLNDRKFHTHTKMYNEMMAFLNGLKKSNAWNEDEALATIKAIMNHYLGTPPAKFTVEGKEYIVEAVLFVNYAEQIMILNHMRLNHLISPLINTY